MSRPINYSDVGAWQWLVQQWERRIAELPPELRDSASARSYVRSLEICQKHLTRAVERALEGKK